MEKPVAASARKTSIAKSFSCRQKATKMILSRADKRALTIM
jgi:hypothetical protein